MKIPTLVTGCNNYKKGFTLIEVLVSIIIIGLVSSIVFINFSVVESFEKNTTSLKEKFNYLSEESMLSGSMIGWYADNKNSKAFYLSNSGEKILKRNLFGDLYIRVVTEVPTSLTKRQKEILSEFKNLEDNKSNPLIKNFFDKARKFWKR